MGGAGVAGGGSIKELENNSLFLTIGEVFDVDRKHSLKEEL